MLEIKTWFFLCAIENCKYEIIISCKKMKPYNSNMYNYYHETISREAKQCASPPMKCLKKSISSQRAQRCKSLRSTTRMSYTSHISGVTYGSFLIIELYKRQCPRQTDLCIWNKNISIHG